MYRTFIEKKHLDVFNHVNNAMYLTLYENARWALISRRGYGLDTIEKTGLGPVILEAKISFLKELRLGDEISISIKMLDYQGKIGKLEQFIIRGEEICSRAEFNFGLFDLKNRRLVLPTKEWLHALGY